jgi:DNA-binding LytR/AlgR family response regulator
MATKPSTNKQVHSPEHERFRTRPLAAINEFDPHMVTKRAANRSSAPARAQVGDDHLEACYVREDGRLVRVIYGSILFLSADSNHVHLHTVDRTLVLHNSLTSVLEQLNDPRFVLVNRSAAVNIDHVLQVDHDSVLVGEEHITLSRNHRNNLLDKLQVIKSR